MSRPDVVQIAPGTYAVTIDGRREVVYVAMDDSGEQWAFCRGHLFRPKATLKASPDAATRAGRSATILPITAPMPATVRKVLVAAGSVVARGETLLILEAMKMELPLRASSDGTVTAVHCREGELVQPDTVLVELS